MPSLAATHAAPPPPEGGAAPLPALPPMARDIARQPEVVAALLRRADELRAFGAAQLRPGAGGRVFVAGCGDGLFAAIAARAGAEAGGLDWRPTNALELALRAATLRPEDRVLAISMSGNVDRTVEAASAAASAGVPVAALVNGGGGRLGALSRAKLSLDVSDVAPFLCGTASHTATVLALLLMAEGAGSPAAAALSDAPSLVAAALAATEATRPDWEALFDPLPTGVRLLSAGAELGAMQFGAAKFVELTRVPAWSADLEEFAHSQYWAMPTSDVVIVSALTPGLARYARDACEALGDLGVRTLAFERTDDPVGTAAARIALPASTEALGPLLASLPLPAIAAHAAERCGLDPSTRLHLKDDAPRFRVSRLLTRRSLLGTGR